MRTIITLRPSFSVIMWVVLFMGTGTRAQAQYVTIPDPAFVTYLQTFYGGCMNGNELDTTCNSILTATGINVIGLGISDLTGVQYFKNLAGLQCQNNLLTELPPLPSTLTNLYCGLNQLTVLNNLPPNLKKLYCHNNFLTSVEFPPKLDSIDCSYNLLTSLPALPDSMLLLNAGHNLINTFPPIPDEDLWLTIIASDNPMKCLPLLPESLTLEICNTQILCLENFPYSIQTCGGPFPSICNYPTECSGWNFQGRAFIDKNDDCVFDGDDEPIEGVIIQVDNGAYFASTFADGSYRIHLGTPGNFTISEVVPYPQISDVICFSNQHNVTIVNPEDTFSSLDFPNKIIELCPLMKVDITSDWPRYCFANNKYSVEYCNAGNDTALNATLEIEFDPEVIPLSSTFPWSSVNGNIYSWALGNILPGACGSFIITDSISCDALIGQTACVHATIYPQGNCTDTSALWDHSDLEARSLCNTNNDTMFFTIRNIGDGDMDASGVAVVYEDDLLLTVDTIQINSGDSVVISIPATGKSYHVETNQHPDHPGQSMPRSFQELCGSGNFSLGYIVPIPQDDKDEWVEIDCHVIEASFDPNEKSAQPSGVGVNHYITADDEIDYTIAFQNTGTDTAFIVYIIDTLDAAYLDVASIQPGASSHPYTFGLFGSGMAKFTFYNILLPDSNVNEPLSHGFVKYKIRQKAGNIPGTVINNKASIYFDFNAPVNTNNVFLTIEDRDSIFHTIGIHDPVAFAKNNVLLFPNPVEDHFTLVVEGLADGEVFKFEVKDVTGRNLLNDYVRNGESFSFTNKLSAGIYIYNLSSHGLLIGKGKMIVQ